MNFENAFTVNRPEIEWFGEIRARAGHDDFADMMRDVDVILAERCQIVGPNQDKTVEYGFEVFDAKGAPVVLNGGQPWDEDRVRLQAFLELQERLAAIDSDETGAVGQFDDDRPLWDWDVDQAA